MEDLQINTGPQPKVQLVITLMDSGEVNVSGPIQDKILCYGLLEIAKEVVVQFAEQQKNRIQQVAAVPGLHV